MAALLAVLPGLAWAQTDHLPKPGATHRQSALNPAPSAKGDTRQRGRMSGDHLLGITQGNATARQVPYSRMGFSPDASVQPDVWPYPQATQGGDTQFAHNGTYFDMGGQVFSDALFPSAIADDQLPAVALPLAPGTPISPLTTAVVGFDPAWIAKTGPSTGANTPGGVDAQYHCAPATAPTAPARRFVWYPRVAGRAGEFRRFAIKIHIPDPDPTIPQVEKRIEDARYTVTYHEPFRDASGALVPGQFVTKTKIYTISQEVGGEFYLTNTDDGSRAYFPMVTERSYTGAPTIGGGPTVGVTARASVQLVTTHTNPQAGEVVVADLVEFDQHAFAYYAAPTMVGPHGGRKTDTGALPPGIPIQQPAAGTNYATNPMVTGTGTAHPNDSFDFANNPRDPAFDVNNGDRANPSVLFQAPLSLIDPRTTAGVRTNQVNAENHQAYRNGPDQIPFFSNAQVLVVRTDFLPSAVDATRTIPVTSIYCLDSATRTVIWRFPDRTHLPGGPRNPRIGTDNFSNPPNDVVYQIANVISFDGGAEGNPDGAIQDNEIFLRGDFSGGAHASVTVVPGISVFGTAQVPTYDATNTNMVGVADSAPERYSKPGVPIRQAIQMPVAFVALPNGTLLALDPFGNNDNRYFEHAADTTKLGNFRNGTTNVLWVFEPKSHPRITTGANPETFQEYSKRLKTEIPVPAGYAASSPTIAWERPDDDGLLNTATQEPRLFVGNQNGVLYALDARARASGVDGTGKPLPLGFRKGEQLINPTATLRAIAYIDATEANDHRGELKWWFRTLAGGQGGAINATPAVSSWAHPRIAGLGSKGVYVTSGEGRVYCLDWQGPVTRGNHETNMVFDGTPGDPVAAAPAPNSAAALNDDRWFHNVQVATDLDGNGVVDAERLEGTLRPRWAFPNTYQNTQLTQKFEFEDPDFSSVFGANRLASRQAGFAPIEGGVSLVDFPYLDPDDTRLSGIRRYVAVSVNDPGSTTGRLLLLDQIGDRRDFLTNPTPQVAIGTSTPFAAAAPAANSRIAGLALDQWVNPLLGGTLSRATPSWIYRPVYDQYDAFGRPIIQQRNAPSTAASPAAPARRPVPTLYVGGGAVGGKGRLYAIDIDEDTGLLVRYRDSGQPQEQALPTDTVIPGPLWTGNVADAGLRDLLNPNDPANPVNPMLRVGGKDAFAFNRILARALNLDNDPTAVESITITGGPLQNRNNPTAKVAADGLPTVPATVGPQVNAAHPSVPLLPTDDAPVVTNVLGNITNFYYNMTLVVPVLPTTDLTARYVNQDIDDPLTTTRGAFLDPTITPAANLENTAYQYPVLWVTTHGSDSQSGSLYEISANIEGEDGSSTLGWAVVEGSLDRLNPEHVIHLSLFGLGGPGTGVVSFTNAYHESLDTDFTARRLAWRAKNGADPSVDFAYYPELEPAAQASLHNDAPRPHFRPRPLFEGNPAAVPAPLLADEHTGQSGFPLDLNGLFYDKTYATTLDPTLPPGNNNEAGKYRLPGYTGIGNPAFTPERPVSDAERAVALVASGGVRSDDFDNVNPAGHRVAWLYVGSTLGVLYEITPVFPSGERNGFGRPRNVPIALNRDGVPFTKVDIFDQADFVALQAAANAGTPRRPRRDPGLPLPADGGVTLDVLSRAAKGKKNLYEWGQKAYVVIWDVPVVAPSYITDPTTGFPIPANPPAPPPSFQVNLVISGKNGTTTVNLPTSAGTVVTYPYVPDYGAGTLSANSHPSRLGVAFYEINISGQTPGQKLHVSVAGGSNIVHLGLPPYPGVVPISRNSGIDALSQRDNVEPDLFVANPLGVQGHLVQTTGNIPAVVENAEGKLMNGIGPFRTATGAGGPGDAASAVADVGASNGTRDPDRASYEFSQALANGNQITRVELNRYDSMGNLNPNFEKVLKDENGANDPTFYVPVAVGLGYGQHGRSASSDIAPNQKNLRIVNRSAQAGLDNIRVKVIRDLNWRWWPTVIPNSDEDTANPRLTPTGMGRDGVINPLPWESRPTAASAYAPWRPVDPSEATQNLGSSVDYPDIPGTTTSSSGSQNVSVMLGGQDLTKGGGQIPNGQLNIAANQRGAINPIVGLADTNALLALNQFAASLTVRIPQHQPANLAAMHSLTSTYKQPSTDDGAFTGGISGPLQLPRKSSIMAPAGAIANAPRSLQSINPVTGVPTGNATIAPYGYTSLAEVWVDTNNNGIRDNNEPYREVEVWAGVPVDLGLGSSNTTDSKPTLVDLGRLPQGLGMENSLLGYGQTPGAFASGFVPGPLNPLGAAGKTPYDASYFKPMTVFNTGNVNLWNLRSSQKVEAPPTLPGSGNFGSGQNFYYFGLKSSAVDDKFGILSVGADPLASLQTANLMPHVVTSLDADLDAAWTTHVQTLVTPVDYARFYAPFNGRHTLKKPLTGNSTPSVLGLPDLPRSDTLAGVTATPVKVGVAVPLGTPSGIYESTASNVSGAPPMLAVFENLDTPNGGYNAVPILNGGAMTTAGPTYGGFNTQGASNPTPGTLPIRTSDPMVPDRNVLRMQNYTGGANPNWVYQPHTSPAVDLRLQVSEAPLTGQIPDFALNNPLLDTSLATVFSGLLPGVDTFPLSETIINPLTTANRPASALSPTAYRGADGSLNVYFVRSEAGGSYKLYFSRLLWNATLGTWQSASNPATAVPVNNPLAAQGRWFSTPVEISTVAGLQSNLSPFAMQVLPTSSAATLLWINSTPNAGGSSTDTILYAPLGADGQPGGVAPLVVNADPNLRRYGVRAAYEPSTSTTLALYYGGPAGKWGLYYVPTPANANGTPTATPDAGNLSTQRRVERALELPGAIASASEPSAVVRRLATVGNGNVPVLDVYYTGVLRSTSTPDLFLSRFRMTGAGLNARLVPVALPVITGEELEKFGRESAYRSRHIAWNRDLTVPTAPVVTIAYKAGPPVTTVAANWQWDSASQTLFQNIQRPTGILQVLVDTSAGIVRFRGVDVPTSVKVAGVADRVLATYQPQAYRLTPDGAADTGSIAFTDLRTAAQTTNGNSFNSILRRPLGAVFTGRHWLLWRKELADKKGSELYSSVRRVGIDLKVTLDNLGNPLLGQNETLGLGARDLVTLNSALAGVTVEVQLGAWTPVAFDVDIKTGKIFVDPFYEGLPIRGAISIYTPATGTNRVGAFGTPANPAVPQTRLGMIEEQPPTIEGQVGPSALSLTKSVNEGQVFGFVDLFAPPLPVRPNGPAPVDLVTGAITDPQLQSGKMWMFWASPRERTGRVIGGPNQLNALPRGYDLFWQSLAPRFESQAP